MEEQDKKQKGFVEKFTEGIQKVFKKKEEPGDEEIKAIQEEARREAQQEIKAEAKVKLKERYKQEEMDKILGTQQKKGGKVTEMFKKEFSGLGKLDTQSAMDKMLGKSTKKKRMAPNGGDYTERVMDSILSSKKPSKKRKETDYLPSDEKLKKMTGASFGSIDTEKALAKMGIKTRKKKGGNNGL